MIRGEHWGHKKESFPPGCADRSAQESGQPVLTEAASLAATVEALDPGQLLLSYT